jgi:holo-[acyl-carrier protein] synthase
VSAVRVGIDLVQVSRIADSLDRHGARFLRRVFTDAEVAYASASPPQMAHRLAARFAAKEATMKALGVGERAMAWRDIEVRRAADGGCALELRGMAHALAADRCITSLALSMSHDGDYATAIVIATVPPSLT